jgi:hypothetical protein
LEVLVVNINHVNSKESCSQGQATHDGSFDSSEGARSVCFAQEASQDPKARQREQQNGKAQPGEAEAREPQQEARCKTVPRESKEVLRVRWLCLAMRSTKMLL